MSLTSSQLDEEVAQHTGPSASISASAPPASSADDYIADVSKMPYPVIGAPILTRRISREYLSPAPLSHERHSTLNGAIFNLSATILGGGILSIPFCFELCGLWFGAAFLLLIAAASNFSIYILISCSRRIRHGASYEEVVATAFGKGLGKFTTLAMFSLVYLCVVAYIILIRDLVTPLLELLLDIHVGSWGRFFVVIFVIILVLPLCLQKSINSLSWTSIVSIVAMLILAYCVVYRGMEQLLLSYTQPNHARFQDGGLKRSPTSWNDAIYALPIFCCSYTCHFNVLPLHRELIFPTRPRIKKMINWVIVFCTFLYMTIGIFGYIYARGLTDGNILNNFREKDPLAVVARISLAFCIISGFPMVVLPTRQLLGKVIEILTPRRLLHKHHHHHHLHQHPVDLLHPHPEHHRSSTAETPSSSRARATSDGTMDPYTDALRALAAARSHQECIDADPLQPTVDSDSEESGDDDSNGSSPRRGGGGGGAQKLFRAIDAPSVHTEYFSPPPLTSSASAGLMVSASATSSSSSSTAATASQDFISPRTLRVDSSLNEATPLLSGQPPSSLDPLPRPTPLIRSFSDTSAAVIAEQRAQHELMSTSASGSTEPQFSDHALTMQTLAICFSAMAISLRVTSVATMWNLVGSSVCIILGFIFPSACYLKIRRDKPLGFRMFCAWALLVLGCLGLLVCTMQTFTTMTTITAAPKADAGVADTANEEDTSTVSP